MPLREAMGATEATAVTMCQPFENWKEMVGSCGRLVRGMEALLLPLTPPGEGKGGERREISEREHEIIRQDGTPGELYLTGPNIMQGYLGAPGKTREVLYEYRGETWYRTGDLMETRGGGRDWFHLARIKDLIWSREKGKGGGGRGRLVCVRPGAVEDILGGNEVVGECAVAGVEVKGEGMVPRAFVVLKEGEEEEERVKGELVRWVAERVSFFLCSRNVGVSIGLTSVEL